jgi:NlpC/P60 family
MGSCALLDDLEYEDYEDAMTADLPVDDHWTLPEDLGDVAPPGQEHKLAPEIDPALGIDPVDAFDAAAIRLARTGLNARDRIRARDLTIQAASLALRHASEIQYTWGPRRWDGIRRNRKAWRGEFPRFQDCSSFATWCLWNGLDHFGIRDVVNGQSWQAGFTGTMTSHGQRVTRNRLMRGDLLFYANAQRVINHVTIYIGGGMVISHGSEPGPRKLNMDYRPVVEIRRYIYP